MTECPSCGTPAAPEANFCGGCGGRLRRGCPSCGGDNPLAFSFCSVCGHELPGSVRAASPVTPPPASAVADWGGAAGVDAERRVITVLFCDLQDSTGLSSRLDPEDFAAITASFQELAAGIVRGAGGYVAKFLGDGILALFGYPTSHEDDARRAVRAGLAIVTAAPHLAHPSGIELAARAGAHTGLVVVGRIGASGPEIDVAGETANVAARLQAMADGGTLLVGDTTNRLVAGSFECVPLGRRPVRGVERPLAVHRAVAEVDGAGRLDGAAWVDEVPLVGRGEERSILANKWSLARQGLGQAVVLMGEPGIGKSRLLRWLLAHVGTVPTVLLRCSPDDQASPLRPVVAALSRAAGVDPGDDVEERVRKVGLVIEDPEDLDAVRPLLGAHSLGPARAPDRQRARAVAALWEWARGVGGAGAGLLVVEDAHWADNSTLEWLQVGVEDLADGRALMLVATARPEFTPPWPAHSHTSVLVLPRLGSAEAVELVTMVAAGTGPTAGGDDRIGQRAHEIAARAEGVPLFIEELTRSVLEGRGDASGGVPATLHESMVARLDRLGPARRTAQLVALLGVDVPLPFVHAVAGRTPDDTLRDLDEVVASGLLLRRGGPQGTYRFRHQLLRDVAKESILISRRRELHRRAADALMTEFPDAAAEQPWLVAGHLTEAGDAREAAQWWAAAARHAATRSAPVESVEHYRRAVSVIRQAPPGEERDREEVALLSDLAGMVQTAGDCSDMPEVTRRAQELSDALDDDRLRFESAGITHRYASLLPDHPLSLHAAVSGVALAEAMGSTGRKINFLAACCYARFYMGETHAALADGLASIEMHEHRSPRPGGTANPTSPIYTARAFVGLALWQQGRLDEAARSLEDARLHLAKAERSFGVAVALLHLIWGYWLLGDRAEVASLVREAEPMGLDNGHRQPELHFQCLRSWSATEPGDQAHASLLNAALRELRSINRMAGAAALFSDLAAAELAAGRPGPARAAAVEGLEFATATGENWLTPELHRLALAAEAMYGDAPAARTSLEEGLAVADRIGSRIQQMRLLTTAVEAGLDPTAADALRDLLQGLPARTDWLDVARAWRAVRSGPGAAVSQLPRRPRTELASSGSSERHLNGP